MDLKIELESKVIQVFEEELASTLTEKILKNVSNVFAS